MSNCAYFASRTPSATFSKSQNTARLRVSWFWGTVASLRLPARIEPGLQTLEVDVDDRCDVEREDLRDDQPANDGEAKRLAHFATGAEAEGNRQRSHQRGK